MRPAQELLPEVTFAKDPYQACEGADAMVIVTEWNQFRMLDLDRIRSRLQHPLVVDLRNVYKPDQMQRAGLQYVSVGR